MDIGGCFPGPVWVTLGGESYLALELKLRHLAALDRWVAGLGDDPFEAGKLAEADPLVRRANLKAAYAAARDGKGQLGFGTTEGDALIYRTAEGAAVFLGIVLRPSRLSRVDLATLAQRVTPPEWEPLMRVAFAVDPFDAISAAIDAEIGLVIPGTSHGHSLTWQQAVGRFAAKRRAWTPKMIGDLYMSQWNLWRSEGEEERKSDRLPANRELFKEAAEKRAAFWRDEPIESPIESPISTPPTQDQGVSDGTS